MNDHTVDKIGHLIRRNSGELLSDSMLTVQSVHDKEHLCEVIKKDLAGFGVRVTPETVSVTPYIYDDRIKWDTYLIEIKGYGVWGMSDGPIS